MKKASILVFSHRIRGNSDLAGELLARRCRKSGLEATVLRSREHPLQGCTGCMRCMFRHPGRCHLPDDLPVYLDALGADALFLVSPVYFLTPVADWKALQDRLLTVRPCTGEGGRWAGIVLTAGLPNWSVAAPLLSVLALCAGHRVAGAETLIGPGPGHFLADDENLERLDRLAGAVLEGAPLPAAGRCTVCFGPLQTTPDGTGCPVCAAPAAPDGTVAWESSRWHPERLAEHYREWVLATRELYLRDRPKIIRKMNELNRNQTGESVIRSNSE